MNTIRREELQEQTNAGGTHKHDYSKDEELLEITEVEGTAFTIVKWDKDLYKIAIGKYIVCDELPSKQVAELKIKNKDWDLVFNIMMLIALDTFKQQRQDPVELAGRELDMAIERLGQDDIEA